MDLLQENPIKDNKTKKLKASLIVIFVLIAVLAIVAIILYFYGKKVATEQFKVYIDQTQNTKLSSNPNNMFLIEDGKIYTSIMGIAEYVGYKAYNGEYKSYSEDTTSCYVTNSKELVTFSSGSKTIRKYPQLGDSESQTFDIGEEVQARGNNLYICQDGLQRAFNLTVNYDIQKNTVNIVTLPYLSSLYEKTIKKASLSDNTLSEEIVFNNQKALLYGYIVIKDPDTKLFGVASVQNSSFDNASAIITERYKTVEFVEGINDFIVMTSDNKYGIIGNNGITKVKPTYDKIQEIDKDIGLYLVTSNSKQGVINQNGKIIVYQDYDQIGLSESYDPNVTNKYLLYNNAIPVMRNKKWGLIDKNGATILNVEYDGIGCNLNTNQSNTNGTVLIPELDGIVIEKDIQENNSKVKKFGVVSSEGNLMVNIVADSAYATTLENKTTYYLNVQNQVIDIVNFWYEQKAKDNNKGQGTTNSTNNNSQSASNQNDSNTKSTGEQEKQSISNASQAQAQSGSQQNAAQTTKQDVTQSQGTN